MLTVQTVKFSQNTLHMKLQFAALTAEFECLYMTQHYRETSLPISKVMLRRTANKASVLRSAGRNTGEQVSSEPTVSQEHTLMVRVAVLL